jgi:hemerythrin-like domain-containing protein
MADVFEILSADHREIEQMLGSLQQTPASAAGASEVVLNARKALAQTLIIESSKHEAVEEELFWPLVRSRLPDGNQFADHAIAQETAAKDVLARLEKMTPGAGEFDELLAQYIPSAREHIRYEEQTVWPPLRAKLSPAEADHCGSRIAAAKKIAPTRPHPRIPPQPGLLKTAGLAAAAADRLRDELTGRAHHNPG